MATQNQRSRSQSTARALLASFLALLLCFATLLGTTYAWFTDSATTGTNTIKAGNLDVDLEYYTGSLSLTSIPTASDDWKSVTADTQIFTAFNADESANYWEPGHTEIAYLKVSNKGSLALKYKLSVSVSKETEGKTADDKSFKLSDYIMFGSVDLQTAETAATDSSGQSSETTKTVITPYSLRNDAISAVESSAEKITSVTSKETDLLKSGEAKYVAVVVYMPTTVGNDANANGGTLPTIEFSVDINATQASYEKDSYDASYDNNASVEDATESATYDWFTNAKTEEGVTVYTLTTANDLAGFAAKVNEGETFEKQKIVLANDVNLPGTNWVSIGTTEHPFKGTFDGQGHTISNLQSNDNRGAEPGGLFGKIENAVISHVTVSGSITLGSLQEGGSSSVYNAIGGICGYAVESTIERCTNEVNIDTTLRTSQDYSAIYAAGILGYGTDCDIKNCLNKGAIKAINSDQAEIGGITSIVEATSGAKGCRILTCLNAGDIEYSDSESDEFGLVWQYDTNVGSIKDSYTLTCSYSYFADDNSTDYVIGEDGKRSEASYSGFDFSEIWMMGNEYPVLR